MGFDSKFRRVDSPTKEPTPILAEINKINLKIFLFLEFCRFLNTLDSPHHKKLISYFVYYFLPLNQIITITPIMDIPDMSNIIVVFIVVFIGVGVGVGVGTLPT